MAEPPPAQEMFFRFALIGIGIATLLRLLWLAGRPIDLYPDEAQYWIWSLHPDWGYYSKPPMVAWMIAATTDLFGESELAIKSGALAAYAGTSIVVYALARRLYDGRIAAWSAIAFITLPAVSISSIIISTDVPLLFFWALATYGFVRAREPSGDRWWLLVGVAAGLGLLAKFAMGFWLGSALGFLVLVPGERRHLRLFLLALLVALVVYAPNFIWNWNHGFVSYLHTRDNADVQQVALHSGSLIRFGGSQFGVFGPIFFATLLYLCLQFRRTFADQRLGLLLVFALPTLAVMLTVAALSRAQPNWSAPAYVTATIAVVAWLTQQRREQLMQWSVVVNVALAVFVLSSADIERLVHRQLPGALDPLHRLRGWETLGRSVADLRIRQGMPHMLADDRELMASLIYYMQPHPFDMAMWNPSGGVHNGFEMSQSLPDRPGGDYLWVTNRIGREDVLARFTSQTEAAHVIVPIGKGLVREVWVYALHGFKGYGALAPASAER
jgi:4-amino-4-deoxy-L-arabinose transferase-like glycosyltransferase